MTPETARPSLPATDRPVAQIDADIILLDDNQVFADAFKFRFLRKKIYHFTDPRDFIEQHQKYARNVVICVDNDYGLTTSLKGLDVAAQLHTLGFTRLYLVSGTFFCDDELPDYLTFIEKINLEFFNVV